MTDLEQVEKYLTWALSKVLEIKGHGDMPPNKITINDLRSYIQMAETASRRL